MPGVSLAELSLAVIAAAFAAAVIVLVPVLLQLRRVAARAEAVLADVDTALPGLLRDLGGLIEKLDRTTDTIANLAASVERLDRLATSTGAAVEGALGTVRRALREVVLPSVANAAGVLSALREGMEWVRPRRDRGRDGR